MIDIWKTILTFGDFPNIRDPSPEFKANWEGVLNKCSEGLMDLLRGHHQLELIEIQKELDALEIKSKKLQGQDGFELRNKDLADYIERFNKNFIQNKSKKFDKDNRAFSQGRAYHWQQNTYNRRFQSRPNRGEGATNHRFSSSGSETDGSSRGAPLVRGRGIQESFTRYHSSRGGKLTESENSEPSTLNPGRNSQNVGGKVNHRETESGPQGRDTSKKKELQNKKAIPKITQMAETLVGPAAGTRNKALGNDTPGITTA